MTKERQVQAKVIAAEQCKNPKPIRLTLHNVQ
jgi:hypothetical protein